MDIKDLKKINLQQIKNTFLIRPNIFINFVWIVLTIFAIIYVYNNYKREKIKINRNLKEVKEKLAIVHAYNTLQQRYEQFIKKFPPSIPDQALMELFSEFAIATNVQIISFSPTEQKREAFFEITSGHILIASDTYENIVRFVDNIENAPYAIRINNWSARISDPQSYRKRFVRGEKLEKQAGTEEKTFIEAKMNIESIKLLNDD